MNAATLREVREEAGIDVTLDGVYRVEHTVLDGAGAAGSAAVGGAESNRKESR